MYQNDPAKVLTGEVRLSYVHLVEPHANANQPGAKAKYSVTLLIPKTDTATKANIDASIQAAAADAVSRKWGGVRPPVINNPVWDGDGVRKSGEPFGPECKGCWVMTASSYNKPQVVDQSNISCELDPRDIYSGMYGRVTVRFFGFANSGNKGVGCGLGNVMKTRDGEPLAGGASAASDFAEVGQNVVAPAAAQQPAFATPVAPGMYQPPGQPLAYPAAPAPAQQPVAAPWAPAPAPAVDPLTGMPINH